MVAELSQSFQMFLLLQAVFCVTVIQQQIARTLAEREAVEVVVVLPSHHYIFNLVGTLQH